MAVVSATDPEEGLATRETVQFRHTGTVKGPMCVGSDRGRCPRMDPIGARTHYHAMALKSSQKNSRMALKKQPYLS